MRRGLGLLLLRGDVFRLPAFRDIWPARRDSLGNRVLGTGYWVRTTRTGHLLLESTHQRASVNEKAAGLRGHEPCKRQRHVDIKIVSRSGSLAGGYDGCPAPVYGHQPLSRRGALWPDRATPSCRCVDAIECRGGLGATLHSNIREPRKYRPRLTCGGRDVPRDCPTTRFPSTAGVRRPDADAE